MSATLTVRKTSCRGAQRLHALPPICHVQKFGDPRSGALFKHLRPVTHPFLSLNWRRLTPPMPSRRCTTRLPQRSGTGLPLSFASATFPGQRWAIVVLEWLSSPRCAPRPVVSSDANSVASLSSLDTVHKLDSLMEVIRPQVVLVPTWHKQFSPHSGICSLPRKHFWVTISCSTIMLSLESDWALVVRIHWVCARGLALRPPFLHFFAVTARQSVDRASAGGSVWRRGLSCCGVSNLDHKEDRLPGN